MDVIGDHPFYQNSGGEWLCFRLALQCSGHDIQNGTHKVGVQRRSFVAATASKEQHPMSDYIAIMANGEALEVERGVTVAAAMMGAGMMTRRSVSGEPRQPLCGMGICYECRVEIDGVAYQRSCQIACRQGMKIVTGR